MMLRRSSWLAALLALALVGCSNSAPHPAAQGDPDLALYRSVLQRVRSSYVDPVSNDRLIDNSLKGMLTGLDPQGGVGARGAFAGKADPADDAQGASA